MGCPQIAYFFIFSPLVVLVSWSTFQLFLIKNSTILKENIFYHHFRFVSIFSHKYLSTLEDI